MATIDDCIVRSAARVPCRETNRLTSRSSRVLVALSAVMLVVVSCSPSDAPQPGTAPGPTAATDAGGTLGDAGCSGPGSVREPPAPFASSTGGKAFVYLPACYDAEPERRFPVLYLLHGADADASQWPDIGVTAAADTAIGSGAIGPLIIVMPDGGAAMPDSLIDGLVDRLVPWTDHEYRTVAEARARAVGGISRGGRIALLAAARHPDLLTVAGGHSPALGPDDATTAVRDGLAMLGGAVTIDVGEADLLRDGVVAFAELALPLAQVTVRPGGHDRRYWGDHVSEYLTFYGTQLDAHAVRTSALIELAFSLRIALPCRSFTDTWWSAYLHRPTVHPTGPSRGASVRFERGEVRCPS